MTRLSHLTLRNILIALHDLMATTAALFAAIYLRFEGGEDFFERLPLLFQILPYFLTGMRPGERLHEILFASEEPTREIGVAGITAAQPNKPPMQTLRKWIAALEQAIARDDRATIRTILKDAEPEFGSIAA